MLPAPFPTDKRSRPDHSRRRCQPPSTLITSPVENGKWPVAMAVTAAATSSGVPQPELKPDARSADKLSPSSHVPAALTERATIGLRFPFYALAEIFLTN